MSVLYIRTRGWEWKTNYSDRPARKSLFSFFPFSNAGKGERIDRCVLQNVIIGKRMFAGEMRDW